MRLLLMPTERFTNPGAASDFVPEGSQGGGVWPNTGGGVSESPLKRKKEEAGMSLLSGHPPTTDSVGWEKASANPGSKIESSNFDDD